MLVFLRLSGSDSILAGEPFNSCLLRWAAITINRKYESIPGHCSSDVEMVRRSLSDLLALAKVFSHNPSKEI
jgi:hypothetical protein